MKNRTIVKAIAVALLTGSVGLAAAADTTTLAASASVQGICKFSAASTPLSFGSINPSTATDATAAASVLYKCTKGTASTGVTATGGLSRTMTSGANNLPYTLALSGGTQTGTGFGSGNDLTLAVTGTVAVADFQNATAGSYSENVTLNILP